MPLSGALLPEGNAMPPQGAAMPLPGALLPEGNAMSPQGAAMPLPGALLDGAGRPLVGDALDRVVAT